MSGRAVHDTVIASGSVCEADEKKCIGCGACISACTYAAIELRETRQGKKAVVNPVICKGDGLCNAICPTGAISLKHFTDEELLTSRWNIHQKIDDLRQSIEGHAGREEVMLRMAKRALEHRAGPSGS